MAKVIQGAFPKGKAQEETNKEDKALPSYILQISIAFSDPLIWRRVQVPGSLNLSQFHEVIQHSMGWTDSHMHQFLVGKISYEPTGKQNIPRESKRFDEVKYKLHELEEGMNFMFTYLYDAGEGWEHEVHLEEVVPPTRELKHPILLAGEMACPPEEVGDIHHYQELIHAQETKTNKEQESLSQLSGKPNFDPKAFDLTAAKERVQFLKESLSLN